MSNIYLIFNICYLLIFSGTIGTLGKLLSKKAKDKHFADGLIHAQTIASQLVAKYANSMMVPKGLRREGVVHDLQVALDAHGYHFNTKYLAGVAEKAYQTYKNNGGDINKAEKVAAPVVNNVKDDIKQAANNDIKDAKTTVLNNDQINNILAKNRQDTINNLEKQGLIK